MTYSPEPGGYGQEMKGRGLKLNIRSWKSTKNQETNDTDLIMEKPSLHMAPHMPVYRCVGKEISGVDQAITHSREEKQYVK